MSGTGQPSSSRRRFAVAATSLALVASLFAILPGTALGAVGIVGSLTGSGISLDKTTFAGGSSTSTPLGGGVDIQASALNDFNAGTITVHAAGFILTGGSASFSGFCSGGFGVTNPPTPSGDDLVITITGNSTGGGICDVSITSIAATPTGNTPTTATLMANYSLGPSWTIGSISTVAGAATHMAFTAQPSGGTQNVAWAGQPAISLYDQFNNVATTSIATVGIAKTGGSPAGTLSCTSTSVAAASGVAQFAGCKIDTVGNNFQLTATSLPSLPLSAPSSLFNITAGSSAYRLGFTQWPAATTPTTLSPGPIVQVQDVSSNPVASMYLVTLHLVTISGSGVLSCPVNPLMSSAGGTADFTGCSVSSNGTYYLTATASGLVTGTSPTFVVSSGGLNKLVFGVNPGSASVAGGLLSVQPVVYYEDQFSNIINDNSLVVQLQVTPGTGTPGAVLTCTGNPSNRQTVTGGVAIFSGCSVNLAGTGYTLTASPFPVLVGSPTSGSSLAFNVGSGGAAYKLGFTQWPTSSTPTTLSPSPVVQVQDIVGNPVAALYNVTLTLVPVSGFGVLTCTQNPMFTSISGTAAFSGCSVSAAGTYYLTASAPGLQSAISPQFTVGGVIGSQVVFTTQPLGAYSGYVPTDSPGHVWTTQPVVTLRNILGQTLTSDYTSRVTLSITPGTPTSGSAGTLSCTTTTTVTVVAGVATFSGCSISTSGTYYQLRATVVSSSVIATGTYVDSSPFTITGTAYGVVAFTTQPLGAYSGYVATGPAGTAFSIQPVVTLRNTSGVVLTTDNSSQVTLSITPGTPTSGGPGTLSCTGGNTKTVTAGVAAFTGCSITQAGTSYQLRATVYTSSFVTVGAYADSLPFTLTASTTSISLTTYPSLVIWGDPFTATIQFTGSGNHSFTLQRLAATDSGWQNILTGTTDSTGRSVLQYTPRFNGQYRVNFAGDSTAGAGQSNTPTVNVRNLVLLRPEWHNVRTVSVGYTQTYTATARPVPSGGLTGGVSRVEFQFWKLVSGHWVKTKSVIVPLSTSGVGTLKYTWNSAGQWYIRAVTLPNPYNWTGSSIVQRMNVQ